MSLPQSRPAQARPPAGAGALARAPAPPQAAHPLALWRTWVALTGLAVVLCIWSTQWLGAGYCDNGDGWRVLRRILAEDVHAPEPGIHTLADTYRMTPLTASNLDQALPRSTSGLLFSVVALATRVAGSLDFHLPVITGLYFLSYLAGMACWWRTSCPRGTRLLATLGWATLLLQPYTLGLFHSLYEEAALVALLPAWTWALQRHWSSGTERISFCLLSLSILLAKPQAFVLLPLVLLTLWRHRSRQAGLAAGLMLLCVMALGYRSQVQQAPFNAFNRLSYGVAISLEGVGHWPARDHLARQAMANQKVDPTQVAHLGLPAGVLDSWGHGFWPYCSQASRPDCSVTEAAGRAGPFLRLLTTRPQLLGLTLRESWWTAVHADYSLNYITSHEGLAATPTSSAILSRGGMVWWLTVVCLVMAAWRRNLLGLCLSAMTLATPTLTVLGDGYYEFERHLLPFMALTWPAALVLLPQSWPRSVANSPYRVEPAPGSQGQSDQRQRAA